MRAIGLMSRVVTNPRSSHTKDLKKMVLDSALLIIQRYKVRIKDKEE